MRKLFAGACCLGLFVASNAQVTGVINEFVNNHTGTDTDEFVEIFGAPNTDLSALTIVEIEGDGGGAGLIDGATFAVGTTDGSGFWTTPFNNNIQENGTLTFLLVTGYTGVLNNDIDVNNDGIIDATFWTSIIDSVGVFDGGASDFVYSSTALDSTLAPSGFTPGGASRFPNGIDTDSAGDWIRNDFDGDGLPSFGNTGTAILPEAFNTPGSTNVQAPIPEPATIIALGLGVAALLRRRKRS